MTFLYWSGVFCLLMVSGVSLLLHFTTKSHGAAYHRRSGVQFLSIGMPHQLRLVNCQFGHSMGLEVNLGREQFCTMCTAERELHSKRFEMITACPQCADVDNHPWDRTAVIDEVVYNDSADPGMVAYTKTRSLGVVRKCKNCSYEWKQK